MLPKQNRLSQKEFDYVYNQGESVSGDIGYIKFLKTDTPTKVSCAVSTDAVKISVARTRIRRRGYAAVEKVVADIPSAYSIIWFLPANTDSKSFDDLRDSFTGMLREAKILTD
jgi:ribonuclease P protein component